MSYGNHYNKHELIDIYGMNSVETCRGIQNESLLKLSPKLPKQYRIS